MRTTTLYLAHFLSVFGLIVGLTSCSTNTPPLPTPGSSTPVVQPSTRIPSTSIVPVLTATTEHTIFVGYYRTSFEISSFVPCAMGDLPGYAKGYWLTADPQVEFYDHYRTTIAASSGSAIAGSDDARAIVFVRFIGQLSPPADPNGAGYGHLGSYTHEITVTQILEMTPYTTKQCAA
jgi:hypothetical protein